MNQDGTRLHISEVFFHSVAKQYDLNELIEEFVESVRRPFPKASRCSCQRYGPTSHLGTKGLCGYGA
jgi:hypothetical protein